MKRQEQKIEYILIYFLVFSCICTHILLRSLRCYATTQLTLFPLPNIQFFKHKYIYININMPRCLNLQTTLHKTQYAFTSVRKMVGSSLASNVLTVKNIMPVCAKNFTRMLKTVMDLKSKKVWRTEYASQGC